MQRKSVDIGTMQVTFTDVFAYKNNDGELVLSDIEIPELEQISDEEAATLANPISKRIKNKWAEIKAERDRRTQTGGYKVGNYWFHSDQTSRIQQLGLVISGQNIPQSLMWKTMSGEFVAMTPTLAQQIFAAASISDMSTFQAAEAHRIAMEASNDPASYDFSGGWPAVYGG